MAIVSLRKATALAAPLLALLLTGCATVMSHGNDPVSFVSFPPGAKVTISDERAVLVHEQQTPFEVDLDAHDGFFDPAEYNVGFEKVCYEPVEVRFGAKSKSGTSGTSCSVA